MTLMGFAAVPIPGQWLVSYDQVVLAAQSIQRFEGQGSFSYGSFDVTAFIDSLPVVPYVGNPALLVKYPTFAIRATGQTNDVAYFFRGTLEYRDGSKDAPFLPSIVTDAVRPNGTVPVFGFGTPTTPARVPGHIWVDPSPADAFNYQMTNDALFAGITNFPTGFNTPFTVSVGGVELGQFGPGQSVDFTSFPGGGVSNFKVSGIAPTVDASNQLAFPLELAFSQELVSFNMTPSAPLLAGDFDLDGHVTPADIGAMLHALTDLRAYQMGFALSDDELRTIGDFDNSGSITNRDIQGMLDLIAIQGGGAVASVPEPISLYLLMIGLIASFPVARASRRGQRTSKCKTEGRQTQPAHRPAQVGP